MATPPVAAACCARWKALPPPPPEPTPLEPGDSSASSRFRLLRPWRPVTATATLFPLDAARDTVTRDDGLGVSFSLGDRGAD